jgi:hypothetical protein
VTDSYFNLNHCGDVLKTSRGEKFICDLPSGHSGPHESGDWEWWEGGPEVRTAPGTRQLLDDTFHKYPDTLLKTERNDAQKTTPRIVSSKESGALLPRAIHDHGREPETNIETNRANALPRDGSGTPESVAERAMSSGWRPWDNVPRELTGDARIAAEKQALASWMDREHSRMKMRDPKEDAETLRLIRITERIREHIFRAPDREAVALRVANESFKSKWAWGWHVERY